MSCDPITAITSTGETVRACPPHLRKSRNARQAFITELRALEIQTLEQDQTLELQQPGASDMSGHQVQRAELGQGAERHDVVISDGRLQEAEAPQVGQIADDPDAVSIDFREGEIDLHDRLAGKCFVDLV